MTTSSKLPDIPEFPSWTILPLVIAGIIAIEVYRKKLHDKMSDFFNPTLDKSKCFTGKLGCESHSPHQFSLNNFIYVPSAITTTGY